MKLDTPEARKTGDYKVYVGRLQYGDPEATIHLDENGGLDLRRVTVDDCDRLIRAAAAAKQEIITVLAEASAPHGTRHVYQGTCQLCGKPEDNELHAEPEPENCGEGHPGDTGVRCTRPKGHESWHVAEPGGDAWEQAGRDEPCSPDAAQVLSAVIAAGTPVVVTDDEADESGPCMMVGCGHGYDDHSLDLEQGDLLYCQRCECRRYLSAAAMRVTA